MGLDHNLLSVLAISTIGAGIIMSDYEPRAWSIVNTIMVALGCLIMALLAAGFWSINTKIDQGDIAINNRLTELSGQIRVTNEQFNKLCQDVARIDTLQKIRIQREERETINGRPIK